jgi:hypothetical protein
LLKLAGLPSGGRSSLLFEELEASGFIDGAVPFGRESRDRIYRLIDEFSYFYHTWMQRRSRTTVADHHWLHLRNTARWRTWSGYAFELVCLKHVNQLRAALGIQGIQATHSPWRYHGRSATDSGAQIDLLIDRADNAINLCEMKYVDGEFVIDKKYAGVLRNKLQAFRRVTHTRKTLFQTMVTTCGVRPNAHSAELVQCSVGMPALFDSRP